MVKLHWGLVTLISRGGKKRDERGRVSLSLGRGKIVCKEEREKAGEREGVIKKRRGRERQRKVGVRTRKRGFQGDVTRKKRGISPGMNRVREFRRVVWPHICPFRARERQQNERLKER